MGSPAESTNIGEMSFAEAQALLFSLDCTLPAPNGSGCSLSARARHAADLAHELQEAQTELKTIRSDSCGYMTACC